jgi:hypothetical protein
VRIRSRKPCVFARRRLFGWYVRLLTSGLHRWCRRQCPQGRRTTGTTFSSLPTAGASVEPRCHARPTVTDGGPGNGTERLRYWSNRGSRSGCDLRPAAVSVPSRRTSPTGPQRCAPAGRREGRNATPGPHTVSGLKIHSLWTVMWTTGWPCGEPPGATGRSVRLA